MNYMMWQTASNEPLEKHLAGAIEYYQKKYGKQPNSAKVNPDIFQKHLAGAIEHETDDAVKLRLIQEASSVDGVAIQPLGIIAVNMLWLGVEDAIEGVAEKAQELVDQAEGMIENESH